MSAFHELRSSILRLAPRDHGVDAAGPVFGILMETGLPEGSSMLVCLVDGTTSFYTSNGHGTVGAGDHEPVRRAAKGFLAGARHHLGYAAPVTEFPTPADGEIAFTFLMTAGDIRRHVARSEALDSGADPSAPLFARGSRVFAELLEVERQVLARARHEIIEGTPIERLAAVERMLEIPEGMELLGALAGDESTPLDARRAVAAGLARARWVVPPSVPERLLDTSDSVLHAHAITMCVRCALTVLLPRIERLVDDSATFWDLDEQVVIAARARRASKILRTKGRDPDFPAASAYEGFRSLILNLQRHELDATADLEAHDVFGLVMDLGFPAGTMTLVCLADGTTSSYYSSGEVRLGGGVHPDVREAAATVLAVARDAAPEAMPTTEVPTADPHEVTFYFLAVSGTRRFASTRAELPSTFTPLFAAGCSVLELLDRPA
jgi:hypothetical protein